MSGDSVNHVEVVSDIGHKQRWYKGHFYRKEGNKEIIDSKKIKIATLILLPLLVIGILFKDAPIEENQSDSTISTPNGVSNYQNEISLNEYSDTKETKLKKLQTKARKIQRLSVVSSSKKVKIPLGAQVRGVLVTGGTNGPIKVKLLEDLESHGEVYIREGSVLWGRGASTEERLLVSFTKYVNEQGKSQEITASAFDITDQILGLKGSIIGRSSKKILAGAGLGVAGAFQTMQEAENMGGVAVVKPSFENALLSGASSAALGIAEQELEELKNKQTVIEVKSGTQIMIVFGEM